MATVTATKATKATKTAPATTVAPTTPAVTAAPTTPAVTAAPTTVVSANGVTIGVNPNTQGVTINGNPAPNVSTPKGSLLLGAHPVTGQAWYTAHAQYPNTAMVTVTAHGMATAKRGASAIRQAALLGYLQANGTNQCTVGVALALGYWPGCISWGVQHALLTVTLPTGNVAAPRYQVAKSYGHAISWANPAAPVVAAPVVAAPKGTGYQG